MRPRLRVVLLAALVLSAAAACSQQVGAGRASSSDDDVEEDDAAKTKLDRFERDGSVFDSRPPESSGESMLLLLPSVSYSGFDGVHTFQVPIQVQGSGTDLELEPADPSAVSITKTALVDATGDKGKYFMLETKKAGVLTLHAKSRGQTADARVIVTSYDPARWTAGQARYENGGGGDPPCTTCHVNGRAIDHSPAAMAAVTDGEVSLIVSQGVRPNHTPIGGTGCTDCTTGGQQHHWTATQEELAGLVTYLRALHPRGFE
jgi:hypothetical protein